ncbi:MAG TPA: TonB-dependent receptor [Gemmatimonadales bacterium]|nr:TonB-dependent receptor [Gemmatimonadales bacterium]
MSRLLVLVGGLLAGLPAGLLAQVPGTARADSAQRLPEVTVSVARRPDTLARLPLATAVVAGAELHRARPTFALADALAFVPGVQAANRYNWSLDQRLAIRGFGARANFGVRGLVVLLDGVPQTLPDGQSQLTNVDLALVDRIEVLRGASSALYGNAAGGVLALTTAPPGDAPLAQTVRVEGGAGGTSKWTARTTGRTGALAGALALSRFTTDGFRQHSAADLRQLAASADWTLSGTTSLALRFGAADDPRADNPGALTPAEYAANPDSAAPLNILRGAGKAVSQQQLAVTLRHADAADGNGARWAITTWGLHRDLDNPLATNTWVAIGRHAGGVRVDASRALGAGALAPLVSLAFDAQVMRDHRTNWLAAAGARTDDLQLDQLETVSALGPSLQLRWEPLPALTLQAGTRWDRLLFRADDRFLADGDASGRRVLSAWSGLLGASWRASAAASPYANVSTAFESPTTTELANRPDGLGGFNDALGPQRATGMELGVRGAAGPLAYTGSAFRTRVRDAIVQFQEVGGRAFFRNAGRTKSDGVEVGLTLRAARTLALVGSYTYTDARFLEYRPQSGAAVDTLDGRRLPGIPRHVARLGLRAGPVRGFTLDADQALTSAMWADDDNAIAVPGWGAGVTNLRAGWEGAVGRLRFAPFAAVENLTARRYVASVTVNGFNGRVLEPAPGRVVYVGAEVGLGTRD